MSDDWTREIEQGDQDILDRFTEGWYRVGDHRINVRKNGGLAWLHDKPSGGRHMVGTREGEVWITESTDPLTLSPSLNCTGCGRHGWVQNGAWVPVPGETEPRG